MRKSSECECMCINIGISPNLIHITWPTWVRSVPRRVACYYKFNVKSGSKKMREGGFSMWNGNIHLPFLLVSKCAQREGKSRVRKADPEEEKSFYTRTHCEAYFTPQTGTTGYPRLLFIAFITEDMEDWSHLSVASLFCSPLLFLPRNPAFQTVNAVFLLYHLWRRHMCDHGQRFRFLVSSSIVVTSGCQWRERLLKETIVQVCVVNGDGATVRIRWTTGSFHQAPALSRSSPTGWTL